MMTSRLLFLVLFFSPAFACRATSECNDNNLCTTDACTDGVCQNLPFITKAQTQLVTNGNAEMDTGVTTATEVDPGQGWTTLQGSFTAVQYNSPDGFPASTSCPSAGRNFFSGGPGSSLTVARQSASIAAYSTEIDAGSVSFTLQAYLGGYLAQRDSATIIATFKDSASNTLLLATIGPVTPADRGSQTVFLFRKTEGTVPVGTRSVTIEIQMTRVDGTYNDGYVDNIMLMIRDQKCCSFDSQCDDNNACTTDTCSTYHCSNTPIPGCSP